MATTDRRKDSILKKWQYTWVTLLLFLLSLGLHWFFGWRAFVNEQQQHGETPVVDEYLVEMVRDTMENWQSEFLQLIWQVAGLAFLWHVGSPQSKEGDERKEEKLDLILRKLDPQQADKLLKELEMKYPKK
jgi:hypothetical protein